jgi:hypothetical protein
MPSINLSVRPFDAAHLIGCTGKHQHCRFSTRSGYSAPSGNAGDILNVLNDMGAQLKWNHWLTVMKAFKQYDNYLVEKPKAWFQVALDFAA